MARSGTAVSGCPHACVGRTLHSRIRTQGGLVAPMPAWDGQAELLLIAVRIGYPHARVGRTAGLPWMAVAPELPPCPRGTDT